MTAQATHNPDILTCLANLSADEVFTPPKLASDMLDLLPQDLFQRSDTTFLDPVCKSGVFLREIARRLNAGLRDQMPDEQARVDHILTKQVFGLATSELTGAISRRSVYCSKKADGKYSITTAFSSYEGHIRLPRTKHKWNGDDKCELCGATKGTYERGEFRESYAYPFIHDVDPRELFDVQFDVIIGNPPYQLSDGGYGRSAAPIYDAFVEQAKLLEPRFLSMVIPSRWFGGGKGLGTFRSSMLTDRRLRVLVDYPAIRDVFPSIDLAGGACYFLWDRDNPGSCDVVSRSRLTGEDRDSRELNEFPTFIRDNVAVRIVRKVLKVDGDKLPPLSEKVSPRKPFGLPTNYPAKGSGVPCWFIQKIGLSYADPRDVTDDIGLLDKWKVLVPFAPIAGQTDFTKPVGFYYEGNTRIARPGECCTETYIVAGVFTTKREAESYRLYLFTKVVRFLLLQAVVSQHVTRDRFYLIPDLQKYDREFSDQMLIERWGLTKTEWQYIDSRISNYGADTAEAAE